MKSHGAPFARQTSPSEGFTDLRRGKLTQVDVLSSAPPLRSLRLWPVLSAAALAASYACYVVPCIAAFGSRRWQEAVASGQLEARAGGPFTQVSVSYAVLLSLTYVSVSFLGLSRMAQQPSPVRRFMFECMGVHNITQCCFNLYCFIFLVSEGHAQGLRIWGNDEDTSERSHVLGRLIWLQYHCRQLQLIETAFMVLQKKFKGVSFLHLYLRVLNLWGWYIACRCVCGGEAFVPALVSSACQSVVYGLYSSLSLLPHSSGGQGARASMVFKVQIMQYVLCAIHSLAASAWGNFPKSLAVLHLFVISNGLILYTEWLSEPVTIANEGVQDAGAAKRVTFSFDSCGWLFVYHFGVGAWLSEHLSLETKGAETQVKELRQDVAFSGSSGGSLIACVLASGVKVREVFDFIVAQQPACRRNPVEMFPAVERALRHFQFRGAHMHLTGRTRVLLTRVTCWPPFFLGEVVDTFPDNDTAVKVLCASCHVPFVAGIRPRCIFGRYYYDGLVWPSRLLVPWRGAPGDHVVRVSACGAPLADIKILRAPYWWALLPPGAKVLRGIFWCGYRDAAIWFASRPSAPDTCKSRCRQKPDTPGAENEAADDDSQLARWQASQALLKTKPNPKLPEVDPVTGEDVLELIALAESSAAQGIQAVSRALTCLLVLTAAVISAMASSFVS